MMNIKIADFIAQFLKQKNIKIIFGIIGAGNAQIVDAIARLGFTEFVCVHHEQAATMAAGAYYRISGKLETAVLVTTGGGSTNAVTGVVTAWMDSIPMLVISGNENSKFTTLENTLRIWGVQGFDSASMVNKVTKYSDCITTPESVIPALEKAYTECLMGRPGPCWIDIPMNLQSTLFSDSTEFCDNNKLPPPIFSESKKFITNKAEAAKKVIEKLNNAQRPLIWLGNGIRLAGADKLIRPLIEKIGCPILVSWSAIDLIDSNHPLVYGRAGVYGQRAANFILQNCDFLLTIGTRLAIPQVGYDITEFAREAEIAVVDIDAKELEKYPSRFDYPIQLDAKVFIETLLNTCINQDFFSHEAWLTQCNYFRDKYPFVDRMHDDKDGYINTYRFIDKLNKHLKKDQIIVTDMGTALLCGHQAIKLTDQQRLHTSQGLGEMGYGICGAIGASFARNKGEVLCLNCDGGMMMNLQELQTIVHHQLPIKIIIFNNDGYLMIKHTQNALFEGRKSGTDSKSGVSCPDYSRIAHAFHIQSFQIKTWDDFDSAIPKMQAAVGPVICEVFMAPDQLFVPKLSVVAKSDGVLVSPPLEDLSPLLSKEELEKNMLIGLHPKSETLKRPC